MKCYDKFIEIWITRTKYCLLFIHITFQERYTYDETHLGILVIFLTFSTSLQVFNAICLWAIFVCWRRRASHVNNLFFVAKKYFCSLEHVLPKSNMQNEFLTYFSLLPKKWLRKRARGTKLSCLTFANRFFALIFFIVALKKLFLYIHFRQKNFLPNGILPRFLSACSIFFGSLISFLVTTLSLFTLTAGLPARKICSLFSLYSMKESSRLFKVAQRKFGEKRRIKALWFE